MPQICTKMNDFKFDFSKIFWGGAHRAPSPRPLPPFFLGLRPRFGLRPQFSGASRLRLGRFAPSIRAPPSTFGRRTWFGPPQNKLLDPPLENNMFKVYITLHRMLKFLSSMKTSDFFQVSRGSSVGIVRQVNNILRSNNRYHKHSLLQKWNETPMKPLNMNRSQSSRNHRERIRFKTISLRHKSKVVYSVKCSQTAGNPLFFSLR